MWSSRRFRDDLPSFHLPDPPKSSSLEQVDSADEETVSDSLQGVPHGSLRRLLPRATPEKYSESEEAVEPSRGKEPKAPKPRGIAKGALERHISPLDEIFSRASTYPSDVCTRNNYKWCNRLQEILFERVARDLGSNPLLIPPEKEDRIYDLTKGFGIYTCMIKCVASNNIFLFVDLQN